jgi:primosomal protein N' (replication factor Y)
MKLRQIRVGVGRVAEEISALVGEPATEVTAATGVIPSDVRILVGTEAVLHKVPSASVVAFIDLDQELLATRFRAAEQAWILLGRAARLLGGDRGERHRRIVVQTRLPNEPLLAAARSGDPTRFLDRELVRRRELRLPPAAALARASGDDAHRFAAAVASIGGPVEVAPLADASYLLRAPDHATLLEVLVRARSTGVSCRVSIDPDDV